LPNRHCGSENETNCLLLRLETRYGKVRLARTGVRDALSIPLENSHIVMIKEVLPARGDPLESDSLILHADDLARTRGNSAGRSVPRDRLRSQISDGSFRTGKRKRDSRLRDPGGPVHLSSRTPTSCYKSSRAGVEPLPFAGEFLCWSDSLFHPCLQSRFVRALISSRKRPKALI
jgi:hypothetical protein